MNKFFSAAPIWQNGGIFILRLIVGVLLVYHGKEVLDPVKMKEYAAWDTFKSSTIMPYLGKGAELVAGVLLMLGLFTRLACVITIGTFAYITFFVGKGKFWMDDQHPFLFVLLGFVFIFTGPGAWSLDRKIFKSNK